MHFLIYLPFIAAAFSLLVGAFFYLQNRSRLRRWRPAAGEIFGWRPVYANRGSRYVSEVRFSTSDGRAITFVSKLGRTAPPILASTVSVLYDHEDPSRAELKEDVAFQHAPLVCIICAAVFCVGGLPIILR
ncbi:MAG: hypothetical protein K0S54_2127 [Alphaproteobacteria bacterium]|jgi:hypothetical protein|nr:hypothetical protein [Alphaproteobacteria bacterium]